MLEVCLDRLEQNPTQIAAVLRDVTDKELLRHWHEEATQQDRFMAILAHELRNPLSPIISSAELILKGTEAEVTRRAAEIILRQARHQARLVDELLDIARVRQGKIVLRREICDLRAPIREAAQATEEHRLGGEIRLELDLPDAPVWVEVDPTRMVQCMVNLLINAAKFTLSGGTNRIRLVADRDIAWIRVCDDGIGIDPPMLGRIFELFMQADESLHRTHGGLGLGLPLVRTLVELHGGGIRAASEGLGQGAQFSLWLPVLDAADVPSQPEWDAPPQERPAPVPHGTVLLVEDNADARETLSELLESAGLNVCSAPDGLRALEVVRECRPNIVVSDIGLPGLDGFELAHRLRKEIPDLFLVALSGYSQAEDRRRAAEAGFDAYFVKPVDIQALLQTITSK